MSIFPQWYRNFLRTLPITEGLWLAFVIAAHTSRWRWFA